MLQVSKLPQFFPLSFIILYCTIRNMRIKKLNAHGCIIPCSGFIFRNLYGFLSVAHHKRCYFCVKLKSVTFQLLVWALRLREIHVLRCTLPLHNVVKALRLLCSHSRTYSITWGGHSMMTRSFCLHSDNFVNCLFIVPCSSIT